MEKYDYIVVNDKVESAADKIGAIIKVEKERTFFKLTNPTIDDLLNKINNRFLLANVIADRAKAITEGSLPYIEDADVAIP